MIKTRSSLRPEVLFVAFTTVVFLFSQFSTTYALNALDLAGTGNNDDWYNPSDICPATAGTTTTTPETGSSTGSGAGLTSGQLYILGDSVMNLTYFGRFLSSNAAPTGPLVNSIASAGFTAKVDASGGRGMDYAGSQPNGGLPGANDSGLNAIPADASAVQNSAAIVIELGTNESDPHDQKYSTQKEQATYSTSLFKNEMTQAIDAVQKINPAAPIYLVNIFSNPNHVDDGSAAGQNTPWSEQYNQAISSVAQAQGINVIDTTNAGITLMNDQIHPDSGGQAKLADLIVQSVKSGGVAGSSGGSSASTGSNSVAPDSADAAQAAQSASTNGTQVGYALYQEPANGGTPTLVGRYDPSKGSQFENYGASITKAMVLVAYLRQLGSGALSSYATTNLTGMIEQSNDTDANNVLSYNLNSAQNNVSPGATPLLNNPLQEIKAVADVAGMTGFKPNFTGDYVYNLGQSQITADDFARFFAQIDTLIPAAHKDFALKLLSNITPQAGLLNASLPGTVYSKEGWKPEPGTVDDHALSGSTDPFGQESAPYIVNQAAQFTQGGITYGVAVTVGGTTNESAGETIIQNVVSKLLNSPGASTNPSVAATSCCSTPASAAASSNSNPPISLPPDATLDDKIAQTFDVGFDANAPNATSTIQAMVTKYHLGGIFLTNTSNAEGVGFTNSFFNTLDQVANTPLTISSDEEGSIQRFSYGHYPNGLPSTQTMGQSYTNSQVETVANNMSQELNTDGVTMDLAPVLDLDIGSNVVTDYKRSFSSDPATVTARAGAFAKGLEANQVTPVFKHFPGFGGVTGGNDATNTDQVPVKVPTSYNFGANVKPYQTLLKQYSNAGLMLSNLYVPAFGNVPTSISGKAVDYIRSTLNFGGLITTDDLLALSHYGPKSESTAVYKALNAGVDMPLFSVTGDEKQIDGELQQIIASVKSHVSTNTISTADQAVLANKNNFTGSSGSGAGNNNGSVYILGDSITAIAEQDYMNTLKTAFPAGVTVNASVSRSLTSGGTGWTGPNDTTASGLDALKQDSAVRSADTIVIALGTNGIGGEPTVENYSFEIDQAISEIKAIKGGAPSPSTYSIYWVDTLVYNRPGYLPTIDTANAAIYGQAGSQGYTVLPWANTVDNGIDPKNEAGATDTNGYIIRDFQQGLGVHPTPDGAKALVNMVASHVAGGAAVSGGSPSSVVMQKVDLSGFHPDPQAVQSFNKTSLPLLKKYIPLYAEAAKDEGVPQNWELLAGIHGPELAYGDYFQPNFLGLYAGPFQEDMRVLATYLNSPAYGPALKDLVTPQGTAVHGSQRVKLTDAQFVVLARIVFKYWVQVKLGNSDYSILQKGPVAFDPNVDSSNWFYRFMPGWNNLPAEFFKGYNTGADPFTMSGSSGIFGPGIATTYYLLKQWEANGGMSTVTTPDSACVGGNLNGTPDCQAALGDVAILCDARQYEGIYYKFGGGHEPYASFRQACPLVRLQVDPNSKTGATLAAEKSGPGPGQAGPCATDCSGIVSVAVDQAFGVSLGWDTNTIKTDSANWQKIDISSVQPGDVVLIDDAVGHVEIVDHSSGGQITTFGSHFPGNRTGPSGSSSPSMWTGGAYRYIGKGS